MPTNDEYWEVLKAKICARCIDGNGRGECNIAGENACALKAHLPLILDAVNAVYSHSILPYEEQLRKKVCVACVHQSGSGRCSLRAEVECALDRYFPLIVETIEETQKRAHLAGSRWNL